MAWIAGTFGFGAYLRRFGDYDVTYGSVGAVVILQLWLYFSAFALLLGARLNVETARQAGRLEAEQPSSGGKGG